MIITVSGAACTGKTTLLNEVERLIPAGDVTFYKEFIRNLYEKDYKDKYKDFAALLEGDPMDIIKIHKDTAKLFNEILWSTDSESVLVFDRSPIDISIYLYMNIANHLDNPNVLREYRKATRYINRLIADFSNHNPVIFYTRPFTDEVAEDGFRPISLIERRSLELSLFDKEFLSIDGVRILPSDLSERVDILFEFISSNADDMRWRKEFYVE